MDIDKGIEYKNKDNYQHQNHIDEKHRYAFNKGNHPAFAIKSMMRREEIVKHPNISRKINYGINGISESIINKETHKFPKKEKHKGYQ